jgi:hypothetical protein
MILNETQVKLIADRGRALPDSVLAPLVLSLVLGEVASPTDATPDTEKPERAPYIGTKRRSDQVVEFLKFHPGSGMVNIYRGIGCHRNVARAATNCAIRDRRVIRKGSGQHTKYYAAAAPQGIAEPLETASSKPEVLLTEQRIDGENKQRLVKIERRKGIAKSTAPMNTKQRRLAIVEYVRAHPGCARGEIVAGIGCTVPQAQYALLHVTRSGELRMDGERAYARYYVRGYVNGAAQSTQTVTA